MRIAGTSPAMTPLLQAAQRLIIQSTFDVREFRRNENKRAAPCGRNINKSASPSDSTSPKNSAPKFDASDSSPNGTLFAF
jgi:hypothetical protein